MKLAWIVLVICVTVSFAWTPYGRLRWRKYPPFYRTSETYYRVLTYLEIAFFSYLICFACCIFNEATSPNLLVSQSHMVNVLFKV